MITSIREQLSTGGIPVADTVFSSCNEAVLDHPLSVAPFLEWQERDGHQALVQKNMAEAMPISEAERQLGKELPGLPGDIPWFCDGLDAIREAMAQGRPIAVEGGPCLFGVDEVLAEVTLKDGTVQMFDESTGRGNNHSFLLPDFLRTNAESVSGIRFLDRKAGVTTQERDSIEWLFRIARPLGAKVVLPLPDLSYEKYMAAITEPLDPNVATMAREAFAEVTGRVAELYIRFAAEVAKDYPEVSYEVVYGGDRELYARYEEVRSPHIERHKTLRNLTNIPEKLESIKDYISMPALPYYLYGITDVLQVDSVDEIDSFRRCRRAHRSVLNLACMMYPERLSADGENTIFQAKQAYKEYL